MQSHTIGYQLEHRVGVAHHVAELDVVAADDHVVERARGVGAGAPRAFQHLFLADAQVFGDVGGRRRALQGLTELGHRAHDPQMCFLQAAVDPNRPGAVAEVALELAQHRRQRIVHEMHAARGIKPIHRLDEADHGHLNEIVQFLAAALKLDRGPSGEGLKCRDHVVTALRAGWIVRCHLGEPQQDSLGLGISVRSAVEDRFDGSVFRCCDL
jgi:hypothetical protein